MADIFQEVDEEVRKDKATDIWRKYGIFLIGSAVSLVIAVAAWNFWGSYQQSRIHARAANYLAAIEAEPELRVTALDKLAGEGGGYGLLSALQAADELVATDPVAAAGRYDAVAQDADAPASLRGIAQLKSALILIDTGAFDAALAKVQPLLSVDGQYRHTAREVSALAAMGKGDMTAAGLFARAIVDDALTPRSLRGRATVMLDILDQPGENQPDF